jgi:hypothetical protein
VIRSTEFLGGYCAAPALLNNQAGGHTMRGVITSRDALKNFSLICAEFGVGCALRVLNAVLRGDKTTFLEVIFTPECPSGRSLPSTTSRPNRKS